MAILVPPYGLKLCLRVHEFNNACKTLYGHQIHSFRFFLKYAGDKEDNLRCDAFLLNG